MVQINLKTKPLKGDDNRSNQRKDAPFPVTEKCFLISQVIIVMEYTVNIYVDQMLNNVYIQY